MKNHVEFSKIVLAVVMLCWLFGVGFGAAMVLREPSMLDSLLTFIGAPVAVAIGFYAWKAKAENVIKLSQKQIDKISTSGIQ